MDWKKIEDMPQEDKNEVFFLFSKEFIDEDFNKSGIIEGHYLEEEGFIGAVWDNDQDNWFAEIVHPTHYSVKKRPNL